VPGPLAAVAVGLVAMAISDLTMIALKISDPRSWTAASVASDALPHLAYGAVTALVLRRALPRSIAAPVTYRSVSAVP
jgi:hypothetical protein